MAISSVSTEGAMKNLQAEMPHWDFDRVVANSQEKWNRELSKVSIEANSKADEETFYTALYHSMLSPTHYMKMWMEIIED